MGLRLRSSKSFTIHLSSHHYITSDIDSIVKEANDKIQFNSMGIFINLQAQQHMCLLQGQDKDTKHKNSTNTETQNTTPSIHKQHGRKAI